MIRVNLLPQKRLTKRESAAGGGQLWLGLVAGGLLIEVVLLLFVYKMKQDELASVKKNNDQTKASIATLKSQVSDHTDIKAKLKELSDREASIQKLQGSRSGPTATVLELSRILTEGRGPTVERDKLEQMKRDNPNAVPNPAWDTRRVWLTSYVDKDRQVKILGGARDGEDVSEFLRRITISEFFEDVRLLPATRTTDTVTHVDIVKFEVQARARY